MSTDDSAPNNPYSAPPVAPQSSQRDGAIPLPAYQTRGMVGQAVVVGVLMAVQGAINCVAGIFAGFYAIFMPVMFDQMQQQAAQQAGQGGPAPQPMPENVGWMLAVGGGVVAVVMIGLGLLLIYCGVSVARYQRRTLATVALASGLITLFTCYCFPTSLCLGIYGMIFLFNQPVALAFELRGQGHSVQEIQKAFFTLQ